MQNINDIVKQSMLGTANGGQLKLEEPLAELLAPVPGDDKERRLLLAAGAAAVYKRAGQLPLAMENKLPAAAADTVPSCSPAIAEIVTQILLMPQTYRSLLPELCGRLARFRQRLPHQVLPLALDVQQQDMRNALLPVLGERGRWLAPLREEWQWASRHCDLSTPEQLEKSIAQWEDVANPAASLSLLRQIRRQAPGRARELVSKVWKQEKAERRLALLEVLAESPHPDDLPFLEQNIYDRGSEVKQLLARMLSVYPQSTWAKRMGERADEIVGYTPGSGETGGKAGDKKGKKKSKKSDDNGFVIDPPQELDKEWEKDGIVADPEAGMGKRAWWLQQVIGLVSPAHWQQRFSLPPAEIVRLAAASEWCVAFAGGLSQAALIAGDIGWVVALWDFWYGYAPAKNDHFEAISRDNWLLRLLTAMPTADKGERAWKCLASTSWRSRGELEGWLAQDADFWNSQGKVYLDQLAAALDKEDKREDWMMWQSTLPIAGFQLPPSHLDHALALWEKSKQKDLQNRYWYRSLQQMIEIVQLRKRIYEEIY